MRSLILASLVIISSLVSAYVDLGPAYRIKLPGAEDWKYVKKYSKDPVFVEGLEFSDDATIIESAGGYSGSKVQKLNIDHTQKKSSTLKYQDLPQNFFGEGCTLFNGQIFMMTYREGKVFVFDQATLKKVKEFSMPKEMEEGWGLTHDATHLWASDGTARLFKINPETFTVQEIIDVKTKDGKDIHYINELEHVDSHIYGNVLPQNIIIKVDKVSGMIEKVWSFEDLHQMQMEHNQKHKVAYWDSMNNVMNGIAYRKSTNTFFVTGKNWNYIFEVQLS